MILGREVWEDNMPVYGARKIWKQLQLDNHELARLTVERLMRIMGFRECRGKAHKITRSNYQQDKPLDLVNRQSTAEQPNQLWVALYHLCCHME